MTPTLFPANATTFTTHGLGDLTDAFSCTVQQVLNGQYELTMVYPVGGIHYEEIDTRAIIYAKPDMVSGKQPFRIYRISRPLDGRVTINARHIAYDMSGIPVSPTSATNIVQALNRVKAAAMVACPFTLTTSRSDVEAFTLPVPSSMFAAMGADENSLLATYGGEWEFDGYTCRLHSQRGIDRGVSIRYGKNLTGITADTDDSEAWTGVVGYWQSTDETVAPVVGSVVPTGTYNYTRVLTVDLSQELEEPTVAEVDAATRAYIAAHDMGKIPQTISVSFALLSQSPEYEHIATQEIVGMGDTVHVYYPDLGVDDTTRVVETTYNVLTERYDTITVGKIDATFVQQFAAQEKKVEKLPTVSMVQSIATTLSDRLLGANGGAVRLLDTNGDGEPDTLYIADNPDPTLAIKVWRFNYEGWAASSSGYGGPYTMGATLDDGLLAEFVTAAHLTAGTIQSETGNFHIDLGTGMLYTSASKTFARADYTEADIDRVEQIALGAITPTAADLAKYDVTATGEIDVYDLQYLQRILRYDADLVVTWHADITPSDAANTIKVGVTFDCGPTSDEWDSFNAGIMRTSAYDVYVQDASVIASGEIVNGTLAANGTLTGPSWPYSTRTLYATVYTAAGYYTTPIPGAIAGIGTHAVYDGTGYRMIQIVTDHEANTTTVTNRSNVGMELTLYYAR